MNKDNYASFEASKQLIDAGIVLVTEFYWFRTSLIEKWELLSADECLRYGESVPAPSMAEVWRELPVYAKIQKFNSTMSRAKFGTGDLLKYMCSIKENINPTDALIDLLIWVRK